MSQTATPGMNGYRVLPSDVANAAADCDNTAAEIEVQLQGLKNYVMDLEAQWHGIASQTFVALMADWDIYAAMLHQSLVGIGNGLRGNWVNYSQSEQSNIANLKSVNGALPGSPGARLS